MAQEPVQRDTTVRFSLAAVRDTPRYTYLIAGVAAIGGMLFGYDIGVISGAEKLLIPAFRLSSGTEELAVAAVLIGAVIGGVIGGRLADRFSRRYTLLAMGILYGVGAIATSLSWDLGSFLAFRILTGVAVGASSLVVPAYIAELSPVSIRGGLVILQQLAISGGILLSYVLDFAFDSAGWGWRPMFAAAVVPAVLLTAGMSIMSHSPRWLAMQGRWDAANEVVGRVNPRHQREEMGRLRSNVEDSAGTSWRELLRPGMRGALVAGVGLAVFQQFVGPNTVLFYTPTIFGYAGVTGNSLLPTIYVGAVLFVFVFPTIAFVDITGRKKLFYLGLGGMGSMLVLLGIAFSVGAKSWGVGVLAILLVYVACYSLSISPLFWLMSAEIFPNRLRAAGASASTVANWSANLLVSVTFLSMINAIGKPWTFWIYAIMAALAIIFIWRFIPETKDQPLEHIDKYWTQGHHWPDSWAA
jgi:sugar porter (SP) family MFS transporter